MIPGLYETLKWLHVGLVTLSVTGFVLRWTASMHEAHWMRARWAHIMPHVLDTLLLASGITLALHWDTSVWQGWLGAKMLALLAYIAFGAAAMTPSRSRPGKIIAFMFAVAAVAWIVSAAVVKSAWGPLAPLKQGIRSAAFVLP